MFCGNCGKKIENNSAFCPACGAKVESAKAGKGKAVNTNIKKYLRLVIAVLVTLAIVVIGIKVISYIQSIPSEKEIQIAANNIQNGALVASDGTWVYYNDHGLCKMKLKNGAKQTVVSSDIHAEHMFCIGNSLYYYTFPGYNVLDGSTGKDLGFSIFTENCIQSDGKKFYVTGSSNYEDSGVYSTNVGNTKKGTKLSDIHPTRLLLQGDYLYIVSAFTSINDTPNEDYGIWRIKTNGKNEMSIFDYCPSYLVFSGDKMYYTNEDRMICSANLDGSNEMVFEDAVVSGGLNVSEEYIFFISSGSQTIYRMNKDGSGMTELNNDNSGSLNIIGEWIFYENRDYDYEIYKMSFDGSYNQPIY